MGQITSRHGPCDDIFGAFVRMHVAGPFNVAVGVLPLPLGPHFILSDSPSHLVPNGLVPYSYCPERSIAIQQNGISRKYFIKQYQVND